MNLLVHSSRKLIVASCTVLALLMPMHLFGMGSSAASANSTGLVIPLYSYPTEGYFQTVAQMAQKYPNVPMIAIINPGGGPGTSYSSTYANAIKMLRSAGVTVLGYVPTEYASYSISTVEHMVNEYLWWYPQVNGLFFDQMNNHPGYENYYSTLDTYSKAHGFVMTMGNPGTSVPSSFIGTMDVLCIHEDATFLSLSTIQSRTMGYPSSNFAYMEYDTALPSLSYLAGISHYVKWIFFTNGVWPAPYSGLPSYFSTEVADVSSLNAPTTVTINSAYADGVEFSGMYAYVKSGGSVIASGFTPLTFDVTSGTQYVVTVDNYQSNVFSHWSTGATSSSITITPASTSSLTAYYNSPATIKVQTVNTNGVTFTGMRVTVYSSSWQELGKGFSTVYFTGETGTTYNICVSNYQNYVFQHWADGSLNSCKTFTPEKSSTLTAVYQT